MLSKQEVTDIETWGVYAGNRCTLPQKLDIGISKTAE